MDKHNVNVNANFTLQRDFSVEFSFLNLFDDNPSVKYKACLSLSPTSYDTQN